MVENNAYDSFSVIGIVYKVRDAQKNWKRIQIKTEESFPMCEASSANNFTESKSFYGWIGGENLPLCEGLKVKMICKISKGKYVNCLSWEYEIPMNSQGTYAFLFSIIGKTGLLNKRAISRLISDYNGETLDLFKNNNENALYKYFFGSKGTSDPVKFDKFQTAIALVADNLASNELTTELVKLGFNLNSARCINRKGGIENIEDFKKQPYAVCMKSGVTLLECENVARKIKYPLFSEDRMIATTVHELNQTIYTGSDMYTELSSHVNRVKQKWFCDVTPEEAQSFNGVYSKALKEYLASENCPIYAIKVNEGNKPKDVLFLRTDLEEEVRSNRKLRALATSSHSCFERSLVERLAQKMNSEEEIAKRGWGFADGQINAIINSLTHKVSIITGGPGTGKTTVTNTIIQLWKQLSTEPVTCMAPTGKAATRMKEQTGEKAQTIHKTVHIIPGEEAELNALRKGLIIVDESSMIDQETLDKMLACVPTGSTLLFLGDVDQLPSVGRGNVLQELLKYGRETGNIAVSVLTETKRQAEGSPIIENAQRINKGDYQLFYDADQFMFVPAKDNDIVLLKKLYLEKIKQYGVDQVVVLCPNRKAHLRFENGRLVPKYYMSSQYLNVVLRDVVNPKKEGQNCLEIKFSNGLSQKEKDDGEVKYQTIEFREGDKVMSWKNKDEIANGDKGEIISIIEEDKTHEIISTIKWESGDEKSYSREELKELKLSLAYALSIHKSQGSEYACVIMPFMIKNYSEGFYTRNLLYTGVTRAKKECTLFGDQVAIKKTIQNKQTGKRKSLLSYWMINEK